MVASILVAKYAWHLPLYPVLSFSAAASAAASVCSASSSASASSSGKHSPRTADSVKHNS